MYTEVRPGADARTLQSEAKKRKFLRHLPLIVGGTLLLAVVLMAVFAPNLTPHDPARQNIIYRLRPPAWVEGGLPQHPLGTDHLGRDIWSRIVHGSRISLQVGALAVLLGGAVGVTLGLLAGFFRGAVDAVLGRLADVQQTLPFIVLILAVVAALGPSLLNLILVLGLGSWVNYYRIVRGEVLAIREQTYVEAALAIGCSRARILLRYILPNVLPSIIIAVTLFVPQIILFEAALSFLGLGVPPPTPTWGSMIADGRGFVETAWWMSVLPGGVLMAAVLAINMVGEWLRDHLDPMQRGR